MKLGWLNIRTQFTIIVVLLSLLSLSAGNAQTNHITPFSNDDLQLKVWIDPASDAVVSQQINLYIELATPRWFTGGTRIGAFEIDNSVVLRREKFAVNSTRIQNQKTWTVQLWTLTLYPQRTGKYLIPRIELETSVADENGEPSVRSLTTESIVFTALIPDQVLAELGSSGEPSWVASTRLEVLESYDKASTNLEVGDAVKRTIEIKSENVAAMMLPVLQFHKTAGLATYQDPAKIEDNVNRGDYLASRTEVITYVVEKPGSYTLPQHTLFWWDLISQSLQHEILAERVISTKGSTVPSEIEEGAADEPVKQALEFEISKIWRYGIAVLIAFMSFWWLRQRLTTTALLKAESVRASDLEHKYIEHCRTGNYSEAGDLLYQWLCGRLGMLDPETTTLKVNNNSMRRWLDSMNAEHALAMFDQLMKLAHGQTVNRNLSQNNNQNTDLLILETLPREIKSILSTIKRDSNDDKIEFHLN